MLLRVSPLDETTELLLTECVDALLAVHRALGPGFLESIYRKAVCTELAFRRVPFEEELAVKVYYRETLVGVQRADLVIGGLVVIEIKSVGQIDRVHVSQVVSYLRAMKLRAGLLANFNVPALKHGLRRIVL